MGFIDEKSNRKYIYMYNLYYLHFIYGGTNESKTTCRSCSS